ADELLDHLTYEGLARRYADTPNSEYLRSMARQEQEHFEFWSRLAGLARSDFKTPRLKISILMLFDRFLGPTFTVRRLEGNEKQTIRKYEEIVQAGSLPPDDTEQLRKIIKDEQDHEEHLKETLSDDRLIYLGAAVLGVNDALVELTGGLSGLVSSIRDPRLIGFSGLVVGIAASMSMAASNFLSTGMSVEESQKARPGPAAAYTGITYLVVTLALVISFFTVSDRHVALAITWGVALLVIVAFSYYSAVLLDEPFHRQLGKMLVLTLGIAVVTFFIGKGLNAWLGVQA
ncbi:MAG: VIT1/CCC1 family protein, partial [Actinomycetota bacterium]